MKQKSIHTSGSREWFVLTAAVSSYMCESGLRHGYSNNSRKSDMDYLEKRKDHVGRDIVKMRKRNGY